MITLLLRDYRPTMHNDISIDESSTDTASASLFNSWEQKLYHLAELLNDRIFYTPYYYSSSLDIPTEEELKDSTVWSQYYE